MNHPTTILCLALSQLISLVLSIANFFFFFLLEEKPHFGLTICPCG